MKSVRVALLGCGTVGAQVVRLLREQGDELAARAGARLELVGVAVRRPPVVLVRDGDARLAVRREEMRDLLARDVR